MDIVAVVGNGVSIAYNDAFALPELTREILVPFYCPELQGALEDL